VIPASIAGPGSTCQPLTAAQPRITYRIHIGTRGQHVKHTAIAIARRDGRWSGHEIGLDAVEDLDAFVEILHDLPGELALGFVEEDDEYLGIVRVTQDGDARVFLSDRRALATSDLADRLFSDALPAGKPADSDDETDNPLLAAPAGDVELLADLGTPADVLVELIAEGGVLPTDVIAEIGERAGCEDALDLLETVD
jgi:putative tRNA adenosine deaminase-associated protein